MAGSQVPERISPNETGITEDDELANAPEWNANLGASADLMDNEQGHAYLRVDWSHKGQQYKTPRNVESCLRQDAYDILNMSLSWESVDRALAGHRGRHQPA